MTEDEMPEIAAEAPPAEAPIADIRSSLRTHVLEDLARRVDEQAVAIEGGPLDGIRVVSMGTFTEIANEIQMTPLPPVDGFTAEVSTPATVLVAAYCPKCGVPATIPVLIDSELRVDSSGSEVRVKAKAKARLHVCGQLTLDAVADGQLAFEIEDIVNPEDALTEEEQAAGNVETEPCPAPGCTLLAEHEGDHEYSPAP
jgi:hypothetical protein